MVILISSLVLLIAGIIAYVFTYGKEISSSVDALPAIVLGVGIALTPISIGCAWGAKSVEAIWDDMAANPMCYSTDSLAEAHKDIVRSKYWATTPFGFHMGYDFPEINVDVMGNTKKYHFVR